MAAKIWTANYNGYEATADKYGLSAVVIVPSSRRIAVTSGQVGVREDGTLAEGIRAQMVEAFKNVEKCLKACAPALDSQTLWALVYQVTTYHAGGIGEEVTDTMAEVARLFLGEHHPAWAGVGVESLAIGSFEIVVAAALPDDMSAKH